MGDLNGSNFEPDRDELEKLAKRFHPTLRWSQLTEAEQEAMLREAWRETKAAERAEPPSPPALPMATQAQVLALAQQVAKFLPLQELAIKASVRSAVRIVARTMRPVLENERKQRDSIQRDVSQMRREFSEQSRRAADLVTGLLIELGRHRKDDIESRELRLAQLEEAVDEALAQLAARR